MITPMPPTRVVATNRPRTRIGSTSQRRASPAATPAAQRPSSGRTTPAERIRLKKSSVGCPEEAKSGESEGEPDEPDGPDDGGASVRVPPEAGTTGSEGPVGSV